MHSVPRRALLLGAAAAGVAGLAACKSSTSASPKAAAHQTTMPTPSPSVTVSAPPLPTPSPTPTQPVIPTGLKTGSKGDGVKALQARLTELGYWNGSKADGKFGDGTHQAVWALQKAAGISKTGTTNAATIKALNEGVRPKIRSKSGTLIEVNLKPDLVMFVIDGELKYTLNCSTGGGYRFMQDGHSNLAYTPKGKFKTYRVIDGKDNGPLGPLWRPRFFHEGIALHGDGSVPSTPVSHGCVRISDEAIDWVWAQKLDPIGTTVWVYSA